MTLCRAKSNEGESCGSYRNSVAASPYSGALGALSASPALAQAVSNTYGYDSLGRLSSMTVTVGTTVATTTYLSDAAGNRTQVVSSGSSGWGTMVWGTGTWGPGH